MKRSLRLGALASLTESKEKKALEAMAEVQKHKTLERQTLDQLVEFRDRYLEHFRNREQAGITGSRMLETRTFMDQLVEAIREQERRVLRLETQIQSQTAAWTQCRHQKTAFEKLMRKEFQKEVQNREKRDQSEIDDRFGRNKDGS